MGGEIFFYFYFEEDSRGPPKKKNTKKSVTERCVGRPPGKNFNMEKFREYDLITMLGIIM